MLPGLVKTVRPLFTADLILISSQWQAALSCCHVHDRAGPLLQKCHMRLADVPVILQF
jgi:hypothetical protein